MRPLMSPPGSPWTIAVYPKADGALSAIAAVGGCTSFADNREGTRRTPLVLALSCGNAYFYMTGGAQNPRRIPLRFGPISCAMAPCIVVLLEALSISSTSVPSPEVAQNALDELAQVLGAILSQYIVALAAAVAGRKPLPIVRVMFEGDRLSVRIVSAGSRRFSPGCAAWIARQFALVPAIRFFLVVPVVFFGRRGGNAWASGIFEGYFAPPGIAGRLLPMAVRGSARDTIELVSPPEPVPGAVPGQLPCPRQPSLSPDTFCDTPAGPILAFGKIMSQIVRGSIRESSCRFSQLMIAIAIIHAVQNTRFGGWRPVRAWALPVQTLRPRRSADVVLDQTRPFIVLVVDLPDGGYEYLLIDPGANKFGITTKYVAAIGDPASYGIPGTMPPLPEMTASLDAPQRPPAGDRTEVHPGNAGILAAVRRINGAPVDVVAVFRAQPVHDNAVSYADNEKLAAKLHNRIPGRNSVDPEGYAPALV